MPPLPPNAIRISLERKGVSRDAHEHADRNLLRGGAGGSHKDLLRKEGVPLGMPVSMPIGIS